MKAHYMRFFFILSSFFVSASILGAPSSYYSGLLTMKSSASNRFMLCGNITVKYTKVKPSAKDYVQDGLVALWDADENVGFKTHSGNTAIWKDLSGNGHDLTVANTALWGSQSANCDGTSRFASSSTFTDTVGMSIDCCYKSTKTESGGQCVAFISASTELSSDKIFIAQDIHSETSKIIIKTTGIDTTYLSGEEAGGRKNCYSYIETPNTMSANDILYLNGLQITDTDDDVWGSPWCDGFVGASVGAGGDFNGSPDWPFEGEINCIRIYNRKLTEDEIKHNHLIDKERFGE